MFKRILLGVLIVILVVIIAAFGFVYYLAHRGIPDYDGEVTLKGLTDDVVVYRDRYAIPHIYAKNEPDLYRAVGYCMAQDRLVQMDLIRRLTAGRLSEIVGDKAVDVDLRMRSLRITEKSQRLYKTVDKNLKECAEAFSDGVNQYLEINTDNLPLEFTILGYKPEAWRPEHSFNVIGYFSFDLSSAWDTEIFFHKVRQKIGEDKLREILPDIPSEKEVIYPQFAEKLTELDVRDSLTSVRELIEEMGLTVFHGSNNWAVSGALTDSGGAIVANDMHLGITAPNVFYRARLKTTEQNGVDLTGVFLPGAPILVAGSNGRIAWGNTNSYGDWSDAVIIMSGGSDDTYMTPDGPREFEVIVERIVVKGQEPVELEIRETIWGPVLDDNPDPNRTIAVSWIAHHTEGVTLNHIALETVSSVEEALRVANTLGMPPQNFVVGDADGNIGWTIAGRIPVRKGYNPLLPADWSGEAGWHGWVEPADYPRVVNPESGRIWTANARVVDGDALRVIGDGGYDLGARARQIRDGLFEIDRFSPEDMLAVQLDDRAIFMSQWRELLLDTLDGKSVNGSKGREEYRQLVEAWLPRASTTSVGYRLVRRFRSEVRNRVFTMLMQPVLETYGEETELRMSQQFEGPLWSLVTQRPAHLLNDNYQSWEDLLVQAVDSNIEYFEENYEGGLEKRTWGERNTARIQHPLSRALPFLSPWLDMPADQLPGDSNLPRAQGQTWGASERFAVSPGSEADGYLHMPAGQSGHPLSDYYRIGHDAWVEGRTSPFLPGEAKHTLVLIPAS